MAAGSFADTCAVIDGLVGAVVAAASASSRPNTTDPASVAIRLPVTSTIFNMANFCLGRLDCLVIKISKLEPFTFSLRCEGRAVTSAIDLVLQLHNCLIGCLQLLPVGQIPLL